jgi:hypothetical protein
VRLNPVFQLKKDWRQRQIVLEILAGRLHLGQLNVKLPQFPVLARSGCCVTDTVFYEEMVGAVRFELI